MGGSGAGGAIAAGSRAVGRVLAYESTFHRNSARSGGAASVAPDFEIVSDDSDWGDGATDNRSDDVNGYTWAGVADFTCTAGVCR